MSIEIPEFTRCCVFLPLRQSLMIWACIRVLLSIGVTVATSVRWAGITDRTAYLDSYHLLVDHVEWLCFVIIVALVEIILGLVFVVGCHLKNVNLMSFYYYHSMFIMALILSLIVYDTVWFIILVNQVEISIIDSVMIIIENCMLFVSNGALQLYGILLIRSEIRKLVTGCDFRFENFAVYDTAAEEILNIEQLNEDEDKKGTKDVEEIIQIARE